MKNIGYAAAALYDGGWRAKDKDILRHEYEFTQEEIDILCEQLAQIESFNKDN